MHLADFLIASEDSKKYRSGKSHLCLIPGAFNPLPLGICILLNFDYNEKLKNCESLSINKYLATHLRFDLSFLIIVGKE
jgi:hypothetical protein